MAAANRRIRPDVVRGAVVVVVVVVGIGRRCFDVCDVVDVRRELRRKHLAQHPTDYVIGGTRGDEQRTQTVADRDDAHYAGDSIIYDVDSGGGNSVNADALCDRVDAFEVRPANRSVIFN